MASKREEKAKVKANWTNNGEPVFITEDCMDLANEMAFSVIVMTHEICEESMKAFDECKCDHINKAVVLEPFCRLTKNVSAFIAEPFKARKLEELSNDVICQAELAKKVNPDTDCSIMHTNVHMVTTIALSAVLAAIEMLNDIAGEAKTWEEIDEYIPLFSFVSALEEFCPEDPDFKKYIVDNKNAILAKELYLAMHSELFEV